MAAGSRQEMLSSATLHNNIGALLQRRGLVEDAVKHYQSAIHDHGDDDRNSSAGLAWFHRKLLAEQERGVEVVDSDTESTTVSVPRRCSLVGTTAVCNSAACCDEQTPLGLEYYKGPIVVTNDADASAAAGFNLASLKYSSSNHNDELEQVLEMLLQEELPENDLVALARDCNAGVILFRLSKTREALGHFEKATAKIKEMGANESDELPYLRIATLLNHARACVRLNDTNTAIELCNQIENAPSCQHLSSSVQNRTRWIRTVAAQYIMGMVHQRQENLQKALECYTAFLSDARHDLGHNHTHVATVLYLKGMVLFDQRKLHHAMLAQLACLRIHEQQEIPVKLEMARVMYSVGRTLHDREEYRDAMRMYQRTLSLQREAAPGSITVATTLCNIARVHHVNGDLDSCLAVNQEIVLLARRLAKGKKHPFVADRLVVLGNVLVEAGRLSEAMEAFADAARSGESDHVRNSRYDIDSRCAATLAKAGLQHPSAATA